MKIPRGYRVATIYDRATDLHTHYVCMCGTVVEKDERSYKCHPCRWQSVMEIQRKEIKWKLL